MRRQLTRVAALLMFLALTDSAAAIDIVVNSLEDLESPPPGTVTLRSALAEANDGQTIRFARRLNGGTIELSIVGEEHSLLVGEVMGMREEESGPVSYLVGYFERDYGRSALYARKDVVLDASSLPLGITLLWVGGELNPARVLAVYGDLTLNNVSVTGGWSVAEELPQGAAVEYEQLSTRARGAGVAVWGVARLSNCKIYDNHAKRDASVPARSRDAGVFGGGVYADIVEMEECVVSGNSLSASGVSGGGVFSVGGAESPRGTSTIDRSAITGNRIRGIFAYGGGAYSDGGGIGKRKTLSVKNSTIARNLVEPLPGVPGFMYGIGYWRGGGIYMSNGHLQIHGSTIVENQVYGKPRIDSLDRPNLAGGVAATIGNAHAVEEMRIGHSVIAGNTVHEVDPAAGSEFAPPVVYAHDIFTGSLLHFKSKGYNRFGVVDFSQILVPVGEPTWETFSRRHFPKVGDEVGVAAADVLGAAVSHSRAIVSVGVGAGRPAVLYYPPRGSALDQIPASSYRVDDTYFEYNIPFGERNDFLAILLYRLESHYGLDAGFSEGFIADFEAFLGSVDTDDDTEGVQPYTDPAGNPILTLGDTLWFGPSITWPKVLSNHPYIHFWHRLDRALIDLQIPGMGPEVLGTAEWAALFPTGPLGEGEDPEIIMTVKAFAGFGFALLEVDQIGTARPANERGDIGAFEVRLAPPQTSLDRVQRSCVNEMNRSGERVSRAQIKQNERCLVDFQNEKLVVPLSFDGCMIADRNDRILRAWRRTVMRENARCTSLDVPPSFAYTDSATVNAAAVDGTMALTYKIFGGPPVLDANLARKTDDEDTASCQREMLKRAYKLENALLGELNKAKKKALKEGAVGSDAELEAALQDVFTSNYKISRAQRVLRRTVDRKCSALPSPPDTIFAGECGEGDLDEVAACAIAAARCEACSMISAFDGLTLDCDRADDGTDNGSCPLLVGNDSGGFFATNASCFPDSLPDSAPANAKLCVDLANSKPDMPFTPDDYQGLPEECKAIVYPECR